MNELSEVLSIGFCVVKPEQIWRIRGGLGFEMPDFQEEDPASTGHFALVR